jgi:hypothetical protein
MKKIICIVSILLICSAVVAQKIDKATFDKLVDYCNCKYTMTYIDSICKIYKDRNDVKAYRDNIKPNIELSIDNPVPFDTFSRLLTTNYMYDKDTVNWKITHDSLYTLYNGKKKDYKNIRSNSEVIECLVNISNIKFTTNNNRENIFNNTTAELKNELKDLFPDTGLFAKIVAFWKQHFIFVESILLIAVIVLLWQRTKKRRIEQIFKQGLQSMYYNETNNDLQQQQAELDKIQIDNLRNRLQQIDESLSLLITMVTEILKQMSGNTNNNYTPKEYADESADAEQNPETLPPQSDVLPESGIQYLYLRTPDDEGCFAKVFNDNENAYYRLFDINGDNAKFEFCGNIARAIANKNAIFDIITQQEGDSTRARNIESISPGEVTRINGKWKVTRKAKVRFV